MPETPDFIRGVEALSVALQAEYRSAPFTVQKQAIVDRINALAEKVADRPKPPPPPADAVPARDPGPVVSQGAPRPKPVEPAA